MEFESAPAAHANPSANSLLSHTTHAAGFGEAIAKEAEVGRHPAKMEGDARDTTANLARMPRADRRLKTLPRLRRIALVDEWRFANKIASRNEACGESRRTHHG